MTGKDAEMSKVDAAPETPTTGQDAEMSKVDEAPETPVTDGEAETPMTDEVGSKIRELIREFYIDSIRSVVFIDDEFPTLETLLRGNNDAVADAEATAVAGMTDPDAPLFSTSTTPSADTGSGAADTANPAEDDRVFQLVESCHRKGLLVDILNDYPAGKDFWKRADLLVLDYEIGRSPDKTFKALRNLSGEKGFKPVIIYTQEGLETAANYTHKTLTGKKGKFKLTSQNDVLCFRYNNLFIAFVSKNSVKDVSRTEGDGFRTEEDGSRTEEDGSRTEEDGSRTEVSSPQGATIDTLLEKLERGLLKDSPSPMNILAWIIAVDLRRHIHENIDRMLPTNEDKASALFAAIHNAGETQTREGGLLALDKILGVLFRKAASSLSDDTQTALTDLLACIGKKCEGENFASVHKLEKAFEKHKDDPYAHLNKFICNEPEIPKKVTTGTIFFRKSQSSKSYYVCVSPECDLARGEWKKLCCVKLTLCGNAPEQLTDLNSNKYILFTAGRSVKMAAVDPLKVNLYDFFLREGVTPEYYRVLPPRQGESPKCEGVKITIVGQLRPEYAHRLMARAGAWHSRIGLDFIEKPFGDEENIRRTRRTRFLRAVPFFFHRRGHGRRTRRPSGRRRFSQA